MNLLIDIGNSRLKWATAEHDVLQIGRPLQHVHVNQQQLLDCWQDLSRPEQIAISCVANDRLYHVIQSAISLLWADVFILRAQSQVKVLDIRNGYQQPEKLGVDRWLSLIAAWQRYHCAICVIDCGTAITADLIDSEGNHLGGSISPGLGLMTQALLTGTAALSNHFNTARFDRPVCWPATTTEEGIGSGVLLAAVGLIEKILARQPGVPLLLTGGDAELIASHLDGPYVIEPELVLHGLQILLKQRLSIL